MLTYVRKKGSYTWHWCKNCTLYPSGDFEKRYSKPTFDLCNKCNFKENMGTCKT